MRPSRMPGPAPPARWWSLPEVGLRTRSIAEVRRFAATSGTAGGGRSARRSDSPDQRRTRAADESESLRNLNSTAPAVVRAAALLDVLAQPGVGALGPSDLARRLDLPKSTVANLCLALEQVRLVRWVDGRYELGPRILELAAGYRESNDPISGFREASRRLRWASQETVNLATIERAEIIYLARHEGTQPIRLAPGIGRRMPAPCSGLGKAMLAQLDTAEVEARIGSLPAFPILTPHSIPNLAALLEDLEAVRQRGYAIDDEENSIGLICYAVALPLARPGAPQRAVSVTLLKARATDTLRDHLVEELRELAAELSHLT